MEMGSMLIRSKKKEKKEGERERQRFRSFMIPGAQSIRDDVVDD